MEKTFDILIVDDNKELAQNLNDILKENGYKTAVALDGQSAIKLCRKREFSLALVDIKLPDISGLKLTEKLSDSSSIMEYIIISGHSTIDNAIEAVRQKKIIAYEKKPLDIGGLLDLINQISGRRKAESAFWKSEEKYRTLIEASSDGFYLLYNRKFEIANKKLLEMFSVTLEDLNRPGFDFIELVAPKSRTLVEDRFRKSTQKVIQEPRYEFTALSKDGREIEVEVSVSYIEYEHGIAVQGIIRDITERKRMEEALKESEARYRDLYENAPNAYFSIDVKDGSILDCNTYALNLLGYDLDSIRTMKVSDLYAGTLSDKTKATDIFRRFQKGQSIRDQELQFKHRDGHPIWISLSVEPIRDRDGNVIRSRSIAIDITERKRLEAQFLQSQKLETIGTLAGGIAHDFNNLLTIILGYSELILNDLGNNNRMCEKIEEIKKAGEEGARLTRQLLAFSRKQVRKPKVLNLNKVVNNMNKMLDRVIGEDVKMKTILEPELGLIEVDPGQIEQVIVNLVVNARDAMHEGGTLTIETNNMELDESYFCERGEKSVPGQYVMLSISDTGIGIDKKTQSQIFEPFFTTKKKDKGSGLGLSTVYGIVKQYGGNISVYSEPGFGAEFKIYLPNVKKDEEAEKKEPEQKKTLIGSETILLVEDDDSLRKLTKNTLQFYGYRVLEFCNGEEALKVSKEIEGSIHLVLTDVVMPVMSGPELVEKLKLIRPEVKVVYMSGYMDKTINSKSVLDSKFGFIEKPFKTEVLGHEIREILDKN